MPDQKDDTRKAGDLSDMPGGRGAQGQGPQQEPVEGSDVGASGGAGAGGDASPRGEPAQGYEEGSGIRQERAGYRVTAPDRGDDEED